MENFLGLVRETGPRLALVLTGILLACAAVLGSATAETCGTSWSTVPSSAKLKTPEAITAVAPDDVWAVGNRGLDKVEAGRIGTGAEHWDGNSWTLFPTPNAGSQTSLVGADALAGDDVWAVGYYTADEDPNELSAGYYKTLVQHWDGTGWEKVTSPNVGQLSNTLADVDAVRPDLAWAVGYYRQDKAHRNTLLLRWDGTSWRSVPSPSPGSHSNALLGVVGTAEDQAWAVGYKKNGASGYRPLVLRYDGASWTEVDVENIMPSAEDSVLTSVSATPDGEIWVAGYYVEGTRYKTLTLRHDGAGWQHVPSANEGDGVTALRDIDASSPTDAWAVGLKYRTNRNVFVASTQHWDGSSWSTFAPAIGNVKSEMLAVGRAPGARQVWAAGRPANVETICLPDGTAAAPPQEETDTDGTASTGSVNQPAPSEASIPGEQTASATEAAEATAVTAVDKAVDAGVAEGTLTRGAVMADFDADGLTDIFLNRHLSASRLYINGGDGRFTEANAGTFVKTDRHGCAAADANGDGLMDLSCTTSGARGTQAKANELYVQRPDHTFADEAERYGVLEPFARGRSATFIDANGDPYPDMYVASELDRADGLPSSNRLFVNEQGENGDGSTYRYYRYAPEFGLEHEVSDGSSSGGNGDVGDLDRDGWQDLVVETSTGLRVYRNDGGSGFTDVAASVGLGQQPLDTTLADVNGDGWLDVVELTRGRLRVLMNNTGTNGGTLAFSGAFSVPLSLGLSVAAGDVNGDERPDIYVMRSQDGTGANAPDQVYLNNGTGRRFTQMPSIPSTDQGKAEAVVPIDHDGNGLTDFLALNGNGTAEGPVQLIAFYPSP